MDSRVVIGVLRRHEPQLRALGVIHAALFGSTVRGEARSDSDLDIMVEVDPSARIGVYEYIGIVEYLQGLFEARVDVSNKAAQRAWVRASAQREAVYAF